MFTFSQMVDEIVAETKRPDLVVDISRFLNQTIREVHFSEDRGAIIFYRENFRESLLTADVDSGFGWDIPEPTQFQSLAGVQYKNVFDDDGEPVWSTETTPGRHLKGMTRFHYRGGGTYVFGGYGGVGAQIALGWFEFPRALKYKSQDARPAEYDIESGWSYADGINSPELEEGARELVTNWLLMRWSDLIAEGLRAKIYKRLSDEARSRTSYSLYSSLRHGLWTSESFEFAG